MQHFQCLCKWQLFWSFLNRTEVLDIVAFYAISVSLVSADILTPRHCHTQEDDSHGSAKNLPTIRFPQLSPNVFNNCFFQTGSQLHSCVAFECEVSSVCFIFPFSLAFCLILYTMSYILDLSDPYLAVLSSVPVLTLKWKLGLAACLDSD